MLTERKELNSIAEKYRAEINRLLSISEGSYAALRERNAEEKDYILFLRMAIGSVMTYLELFNREFFIKVLQIDPELIGGPVPMRMCGELYFSYQDIIRLYSDNGFKEMFAWMAKKIYKVFDYNTMSIDKYISEFLDFFLGLKFKDTCKKCNLDINLLKRYIDLRHQIADDDLRDLDSGESLSLSKCRDLVIGFINIAEERTLSMIFTPEAKKYGLLAFWDTEIIYQLERILRPEGIKTITCIPSADPLKILESKHEKIAFIILKLLSDYSLLEKIKTNEKYKDIPVIVMGFSFDIEKAKKGGADVFLNMSFSKDKILKILEEIRNKNN